MAPPSTWMGAAHNDRRNNHPPLTPPHPSHLDVLHPQHIPLSPLASRPPTLSLTTLRVLPSCTCKPHPPEPQTPTGQASQPEPHPTSSLTPRPNQDLQASSPLPALHPLLQSRQTQNRPCKPHLGAARRARSDTKKQGSGLNRPPRAAAGGVATFPAVRPMAPCPPPPAKSATGGRWRTPRQSARSRPCPHPDHGAGRTVAISASKPIALMRWMQPH